MLIPQYWAEGRVQGKVRRGNRNAAATVRRYGWSDISQEDAQFMADARAQEAWDRLASGEFVERRERKEAYNGAEGMPIREEIIGRHHQSIITRNSYGARCLNTPEVLFADVDFTTPAFTLLSSVLILLLAAGGYVTGHELYNNKIGLLGAVVALFAGAAVVQGIIRLRSWLKGGPQGVARARVEAFCQSHPDWNLRLYRTPAGLRILAVHRLFQPSEPAVAEFFNALGTDPVYVRMCLRQNCFRARVSPKPWRIGIAEHMKPRPGVWPVHPDRLPMRAAWIETYEHAAKAFASCRFMESMGSGAVHAQVQPVLQLHDQLSRANTNLPLA